MLSVILIWLYVIGTTYIIGYSLLNSLTGVARMQSRRGDRTYPYAVHFQENYLIAGIITVTLYAQIFSIFGKVGLSANVILFLAAAFLCAFQIRKILTEGRRFWETLFSTRSFWLYCSIFLLFAYGTSHGIMHYDTGLYHAQAIHWIESYGVVKGLGNLHVRLAYNSAAFPLSALYSFAFLGGQSYHTLAGYFALLLAWQCVDLKNIRRRKKTTLPDAARIVAIYYLFTIFDEIVSPASDYFVITLLCYIIIQWLDLDLNHEKSVVPYIFLCIAAVYAVTLKLSAAPFLLLAVKPIIMMIQRKRKAYIRITVYSFLAGLLTIVPFLIRNVILSGWLIYPFTALDLFHFSWKIPIGTAKYDAREIAVYGRGYTDVNRYAEPLRAWVPAWFERAGKINQIMLIADIVSLLCLGVLFAFWIIVIRTKDTRINGKADKIILLDHIRMVTLGDFLFIEMILYLALLFWFFSAPLIRYGSLFILFPAALMGYRVIVCAQHRVRADVSVRMYQFISIVIVLFLAYKSAMLLCQEVPHIDMKYLFKQEDYLQYEVKPYTISGITFYYPATGDQTGYSPFPSVPAKKKIELRGKNLADGFNSSAAE
ncbi:MAG: hypothetical protein KA965_05970 [Butyrivibrio sp.]|nr:hypothetical protein [Butyrivibrio sp.]